MRTRMVVAAAMLAAAASVAGQTQPAKKTGDVTVPNGATLTIGSRAPELVIDKWVKGEPITGFEKGRVYVVEFWATWCGPCLGSMPHLTALQEKYKNKGVTVIGVTYEDPNNTLKDVERMVAEKGPGIGYTVAWDSGRQTHAAWMQAAKQSGIPASFIVNKEGLVAFIGHPMWLDEPLEKVVAGTWDAEAGSARIADLHRSVAEVLRLGKDEPKAALKLLAEVEEKADPLPPSVMSLKFNLLLRAEQYGDAYRLGDRLVYNATQEKNVMELTDIAWTIADPQGTVKNKDLGLAMKAAEAACVLSGWKDAAVLDTFARVCFLKNDVKKAVEVQTKAVEVSEPGFKEQLTETLEEYKRALNK